jgi:phage/plasmid-like protein (TIGR03299 family)
MSDIEITGNETSTTVERSEVIVPSDEIVAPTRSNRVFSGLGRGFDTPISARAAMNVSALDFPIEKRPVFLADGTKIKDKMAMVRLDTGAPIGLVGKKYEPISNVAIAEWIDLLLGVSSSTVEAIGSADGGAVMWCLCRLEGLMDILPNDPLAKYLLVLSSHNASFSLTVAATSIRVRCANTIRLALANSRDKLTLRHTKNVRRALSQAHSAFERSEAHFNRLQGFFRDLATMKMSQDEVSFFVNRVFPAKETDQGNKVTPQVETSRRMLSSLIQGNGLIGFDDLTPTRWLAINAVTQMVDRSVPVRGTTNRLENSLLDRGTAAKLRARAVELLSRPTLT